MKRIFRQTMIKFDICDIILHHNISFILAFDVGLNNYFY